MKKLLLSTAALLSIAFIPLIPIANSAEGLSGNYLNVFGGTLFGPLKQTATTFPITITGNSTTLSPISGTLLEVIGKDATNTRIALRTFGSTPTITTQVANGTAAAPTAITAGNTLSIIEGRGYDGVAYSGHQAQLRYFARNNWSASDHSTYANIALTPSGSTTEATAITFGYNTTGTTGGSIVVGDVTTAYSYDDQAGNGINTTSSYYVNGLALRASNLIDGTSGTGALAKVTSPTFVTPALGTPASGDASNLTNIPVAQAKSGSILPAANGGAGTVNGALKGDGSGNVSQANCASLSDGATGCSTATGTSGATLPLLNGTNTFSGTQIFGTTRGTVTTDSSTARTLAATDCGTTLRFTSSSAVTLTTLNSLLAGCAIAVEQAGTAQVTIANGSGATSHSAHSYTKTFGQYAIIGLFVDINSGGSAADFIITGDGA